MELIFQVRFGDFEAFFSGKIVLTPAYADLVTLYLLRLYRILLVIADNLNYGHGSILVGDKILVIGGWALDGLGELVIYSIVHSR